VAAISLRIQAQRCNKQNYYSCQLP